MDNPKVSLFASAVRPAIWKPLFESLKSTSVDYEVVFAGNAMASCNEKLKYIITGNIKPAQCYEIARRHCTGETVMWIADDCEFHNDIVGKAYKYWKSKNDEKLILSIQTAESGYNTPVCTLFDMQAHRFYGGGYDTPLMAPIVLMSRKYLDGLGGLDRRYVCGQYENDIVMRAYSKGSTLEIFGDKDCLVEIDHLKKSLDIGESKNMETFEQRPFAKGYAIDRSVLEGSWSVFDHAYAFRILSEDKFKHEIPAKGNMPISLRKVVSQQVDRFEPYEKDISYEVSESNNIPEIWK